MSNYIMATNQVSKQNGLVKKGMIYYIPIQVGTVQGHNYIILNDRYRSDGRILCGSITSNRNGNRDFQVPIAFDNSVAFINPEFLRYERGDAMKARNFHGVLLDTPFMCSDGLMDLIIDLHAYLMGATHQEDHEEEIVEAYNQYVEDFKHYFSNMKEHREEAYGRRITTDYTIRPIDEDYIEGVERPVPLLVDDDTDIEEDDYNEEELEDIVLDGQESIGSDDLTKALANIKIEADAKESPKATDMGAGAKVQARNATDEDIIKFFKYAHEHTYDEIAVVLGYSNKASVPQRAKRLKAEADKRGLTVLKPMSARF